MKPRRRFLFLPLVLPLALAAVLSAGAAHANELKPYKGDPQPPALSLRDLNGRTHTLRQYRGRVVLLNFWASWCPPCVHELPSMQRLQQRLDKRPFTILAVNMGEDLATVRDFITRKAKVKFPVLLDDQGEALKAWKVFAFPTSFVLDTDGKIRYALFGELQWDEPGVAAKLEALLPAVRR